MKITRKSVFSGITRALDLPITDIQWQNYMGGTLVQNAFPNLTDDEREFILTGITKEEWDKMFKEEDEINDFNS